MAMNKIILASASILLASVVAAAAMPKAPLTEGTNGTDLIQVKSKKNMGHMSDKHMSGKNMKGMKGMGGGDMKGGSMKGMKGM